MSTITQLLCIESIELYPKRKKALLLKGGLGLSSLTWPLYRSTFDIQTLEIVSIMSRDFRLDD